MAIDQLKGAAGIEFLTRDISANSVVDANTFKVGLVGWTPKGPANQVVSVNSTNQLHSLFGTPGKQAKNNQLLYAAKLLIDTGAVVKIVRQVEVDENLDAVAVKFVSSNTSDYDTVLSGGYSGGFSGQPSYVGIYSGYSAVSKKIEDVLNKVDNITITESADPDSPFTLATKYPGIKGIYVTLQTYSFYGSTDESALIGGVRPKNTDTFTSKQINEDIEFTAYAMAEGLYDTTVDRYFPNDTFTIEDDFDEAVTVTGGFKRYDSENGVWVNNDALTRFIHVFGILRVYASATSTTPIQTTPFTRYNYVTAGSKQLKFDAITKTNSLVIGNINEAFSGSWLNRTPYVIVRAAPTGNVVSRYVTKPVLVALSGGTASTDAIGYDYSSGWELFKDMSKVNVDLLCAAGTTVGSFGDRYEMLETIQTSTIVKMLEVATVRKDCVAIFDLPKRKDITSLIEYVEEAVPSIGLESGGSNATFESFWGGMFDGRQIMFDTFNKKDVEVAMTAFVAQNYTNVHLNNFPWSIVAGTNRGTIGYPSNGPVYTRYYPDEVGELSRARINSCRMLDGQILWFESSLQAKDTSLNRLHSASLLAYIYKKHRKELTPYVFELNTPELRKTITNLVESNMEYIKANKGVYNYVVICNDTNNTPDIIDANRLIVDLAIEITKGAEVITFRNTVYRTNGLIEAGLI